LQLVSAPDPRRSLAGSHAAGYSRETFATQALQWVSRVQRLQQHSIGYLGDSFTGQKTQPTVSKYRSGKRYKSKETPKNQTTQNTAKQ